MILRDMKALSVRRDTFVFFKIGPDPSDQVAFENW